MNRTTTKAISILFVLLIGFTSFNSFAMVACDNDENAQNAAIAAEHDSTDHAHADSTETAQLEAACFMHCGDTAGCTMSSCTVCGGALSEGSVIQSVNFQISNLTIHRSLLTSIYHASPYRPPQA